MGIEIGVLVLFSVICGFRFFVYVFKDLIYVLVFFVVFLRGVVRFFFFIFRKILGGSVVSRFGGGCF